jgi:hypothetical protein
MYGNNESLIALSMGHQQSIPRAEFEVDVLSRTVIV